MRVTVSDGGVTAIFTALSTTRGGGGRVDAFAHAGLTVKASGQPVRKIAISPPFGFSTAPGATMLASLTGPLQGGEICVARFASGAGRGGAGRGGAAQSGAREVTAVLVGTYSGGAHCCTWVYADVAAPRGALLPKPVWQDIGNPGVRLRDHAGSTLLVTSDDAFAYEFSYYAASGMPVRVLELRGGKFVNTTREHLKFVAADERFWWGTYKKDVVPNRTQIGDGLGLLAPWVADECLLGNGATAWATMNRLQQEGALSPGVPGWPHGAAYLKALGGFLVRGGYCPKSPNAST